MRSGARSKPVVVNIILTGRLGVSSMSMGSSAITVACRGISNTSGTIGRAVNVHTVSSCPARLRALPLGGSMKVSFRRIETLAPIPQSRIPPLITEEASSCTCRARPRVVLRCRR